MTTIDESLFGVKDFGEMTLLEFANFHNLIFDSFFYNKPCLGFGVNNPIERMLYRSFHNISYGIDPSHKYGVKFEIVLSDNRGGYDSCMIDFYIKAWIDGVEINSIQWVHTLNSYREWGGIHCINEAHNKYLHALHYAEFKANMARITEDLVADAMHPRRLMRHLDLGGDIEDF